MAKITKAQARRRCGEAARKLEMAMMQKDLSSIQRKKLFDLMNKCLDSQKYFL